VLRPTCCRVCTAGKACGDSCIAANLTCRQGAGCACNGSLDYERGLYHVTTQDGEVYELVLSDAELAYLRDEPALSSCPDGALVIDGMELVAS